ncbi:MAG: repair protein RecN [Bacteroidota bacterium]|jgi:DNA repair protein RecN (Recombination protein N)
MLKTLSIENYALIDALELSLEKKFSIITGETGAGKSILLGALSLLTGQRADASVLQDPDKKCVVEAVFDVKQYGLSAFFQENDLDYDDLTTIRRIIAPGGKSRAFVNDVPVTVQQLKALSPKLIDIHSQHQNLLLSDDRFQLDVVDSFAQNTALRVSYAEAFGQMKKAEKSLADLKARVKEVNREAEYIRYQFEELQAARLDVNEPAELEAELEALSHAEDIKLGLSAAHSQLSTEATGALSLIRGALNAMRKISGYYPKAEGFADRLDSVYYELKDLADETDVLSERQDFDPERLQFLNQRIALYFDLQKKHRCVTIMDLVQLRDKYKGQMQEIENFDYYLEEAQKLYDTHFSTAHTLAKSLHDKRMSVIPSIESQLVAQLQLLGMPNSQLEIRTISSAQLQSSGFDEVTFLFSANKSGSLQAIDKVASGGEISRVMLTLKYLLGQHSNLPTIIFDEIDTGVSGDIAEKMGNIMRSMSAHMQVVSITHLPQVAAQGEAHFKVFKTDEAGQTQTRLRCLEKDERTQEIAKMLSGSQLTEAAIRNAESLLGL